MKVRQIEKPFEQLTPGWYAIGFLITQSRMEYGPIYKWTGCEFLDEDGEIVESLYDPNIGLHVYIDAADSYLEQ